MKDPLAGRRQDINEGRASGLEWPDKGEGCPVEVGQTFALRSCWISITRIQRIQRKGGWKYLALFNRYTPDKVYLLAPTGYTEDEEQALRAQHKTVHHPFDNLVDRNLRQPPEPEGPPPEEIPNYIGSLEAQQRYERDMAERRMEEAEAPLEQRLARLREQSRLRNIDISSELRVIEKRIASAESKVLERAAA